MIYWLVIGGIIVPAATVPTPATNGATIRGETIEDALIISVTLSTGNYHLCGLSEVPLTSFNP